jgi:hypothetical protein
MRERALERAVEAEKNDKRKTRLAAALKENLKRRKSQARAKAGSDASPAPGKARTLGTAAQAGLEEAPGSGPKTAPKRN